jgi:hypothetical protein
MILTSIETSFLPQQWYSVFLMMQKTFHVLIFVSFKPQFSVGFNDCYVMNGGKTLSIYDTASFEAKAHLESSV